MKNIIFTILLTISFNNSYGTIYEYQSTNPITFSWVKNLARNIITSSKTKQAFICSAFNNLNFLIQEKKYVAEFLYNLTLLNSGLDYVPRNFWGYHVYIRLLRYALMHFTFNNEDLFIINHLIEYFLQCHYSYILPGNIDFYPWTIELIVKNEHIPMTQSTFFTNSPNNSSDNNDKEGTYTIQLNK